MERRLAAILAADVVGYSRLMGADEEATLSTLDAYRRVIDDLIGNHRGRVFGAVPSIYSIRPSDRGILQEFAVRVRFVRID